MPTARQCVGAALQSLNLFVIIMTTDVVFPLYKDPMTRAYLMIWYAFLFVGMMAGLTSVVSSMFSSPDILSPVTDHLMTYHYLFCWTTLTFGYPALVVEFWKAYYPGTIAYIHYVLCITPLVALIIRDANTTIIVTTIAVIFAALSHIYVCYLAQNMLGVYSALATLFVLFMISIPARRKFLKISSRELYVAGFAGATHLFTQAIVFMAANPKHLQSLALFKSQ